MKSQDHINTATTNEKVWYITGASKGLGLSLVKKLLANGHKVAATSRDITQLQAAVGSFEQGSFLALQVDLTDDQSVKESIQAAHSYFDRIDVVVNNAGYGIGGAVEELTQHEIKKSFEINVFATVRVIQQVMPYLRAQHSGHIINISSIAGFAPNVGWAMYGAVKYAVMGLSEVLAEDVKSLGIKVTVVAPGAFRTQFLSAGSLELSSHKIEDYKAIHESHQKYLDMDGLQIGDPDKAAEIFIRITELENPPVRLFLGTDANKRADAKIDILKSELENWKELGLSTDFA